MIGEWIMEGEGGCSGVMLSYNNRFEGYSDT